MVKYIDEYRNPQLAQALTKKIRAISLNTQANLMEVCGGHTFTIMKYGINQLFPKKLRLISGPGCPVCVTSNKLIDYAIILARQPELIITTFGDLIRVPGSRSSLQTEKSKGSDIRICYSALDAVEIAAKNPRKEIVFLGIGFETTAPTVAAAILAARAKGLTNFSVLSTHKTMPRAMQALVEAENLALDGFICPGHVSSITGLGIYEFIASDYRIPCVVSGFEPLDLLESIYMLMKQIQENRARVENQYKRCVRYEGNPKAKSLMEKVFQPTDMEWRGLGIIPSSGLKIRSSFQQYDAYVRFDIKVPPVEETPGCICGDIMRGVKTPRECKLFRRICTPQNPQGACMVSSEGTCATFYQYQQ